LHLLEKLRQIEGIDYRSHRKPYGSAKEPGASHASAPNGSEQEAQKQQLSTLDKDIELLITGYGFRNLLSSNSNNR
jgi:hypothetical protein